jgi:hypothetical protein
MKIHTENFFGILISTRLVKEVNHIRCFAIDIAKDLILLSCRLAMEHLCVLQLETALATLVTTVGFQRLVKLTEMTSWSTKKKRSTNPLFSLTILL